MQRYRFVDTDSHVFEPEDIWDNYLEPEYRGVIRSVNKYVGDSLAFYQKIEVGGYTIPTDGIDPKSPSPSLLLAEEEATNVGLGEVLPGLGDAYEDYARKNFPPDIYEEAMDSSGVDYMIIYPTVGLYSTSAPSTDAPTAAAIRRAYNNWLYDFCSEAGDRVIGAASIDLRDPDEAIKEVRRCVRDLGFKAAHINPTPVGEHRVYDPFYDRLWAEIADLDVPVGVHVGSGNPSDIMLYHYLRGLQPTQVTTAFTMGNMLASASFIMGGVLERHPTLRLVHLESGAGWVAFWLDRLEAGAFGGFRDVDKPGLKLTPTEYFQRQCYISADPDDPGIKQVIDVMGDDNIVTALDFSHPEGRRYRGAVQAFLNLPDISEESKRKILWDNALKLHSIVPATVPSLD